MKASKENKVSEEQQKKIDAIELDKKVASVDNAAPSASFDTR